MSYERGFTSFEGIKGRKDKDDFISLIFIKKEYFYYKLENFNCKLGEARQRESRRTSTVTTTSNPATTSNF